ncbi:hypothetical protein [Niabella ginsengisoli]|uniref:DUF5723 domain-containing protein n=1 Tax=Niabella ginsengisoli TaxID=522298 RepID=A0ABS9SGE9_9BACT|nr:hypothetical protein [Niabella ginsengisoli]MCH5597442.1 hypothetical protein [Niabella ginsengisoli]
MKKYVFLLSLSIGSSIMGFSQDLLGLSTGNYAGITGMNLNPASIVDSRLKFDLNLIGVSNYYSNNYLSVKRDALIKGSFSRISIRIGHWCKKTCCMKINWQQTNE